MELNVSVGGDIDLDTVITGEVVWFNPETDDMETRPKTLGDLVAEKLADKFMDRLREDHDGFQAYNRLLRDARTKIIQERIEPTIVKALEGEPIKLTNQYGEPTGREVTLNQLIVDEAKKAVTKPDPRSGRNESILATTVRNEVGRKFEAELAEAINGAKKEIVAALRAKAAEFLTEATLGRAAKTVTVR